jgi:hypothetical protein
MTATRRHVVSSFSIVKGALISETYDILARWDFGLNKRANLDRLRDENYIAASSVTWLRDVAKVLNRRLDPNGRDRPLVTLAHGGCPMDEWKPILLWHITRDEFLLRDFLINWLAVAHEEGAYRVRPDDLYGYLRTLGSRGGETEHQWADSTLARVASGLLRIAADFGLLTGGVVREFPSYHLPERSLLYLLHAVLEYERGSPQRMMASAEWRMYLMQPKDLEAQLLRLHQFAQLDYQAAGTLVQIAFREPNAAAYAEAMVA